MELGKDIKRQPSIYSIEETIFNYTEIRVLREPITRMRLRLIRQMPRTGSRFKL